MTTSQYASIFSHCGLKTISFLNTHKSYRYKASTLKLSEMIALFILYLEKVIFIEVEGPNFWGDRWKNRAKIEKGPQSPRYLGAIFSAPPIILEHV